ncbi:MULTISPECIES: LytTR family DNA-binding domain-containing protein [Gemella]|uniref:LytTR family DNA-binding domain-containing protein n=1 Tax=Gemella TaxID=1378 RepID=UPI0007681A3B|nr:MULTISPECIES: LytTR family DNA-binding domain-containing protein [Gemella]AME10075.1 response regulator [Gemella sp. oral taxon 928]AXI26210.1 LytTR family transcriptional regulator [Gemella sp. ND 6198]
MKLELNINKDIKETLVHIYTRTVDEEVQNLINYIEHNTTYLVGYNETETRILKFDEIVRIFIENRKLYVKTIDNIFTIKMKLYEVEKILGKDFVKISQSEIANIHYIKNLDLGIKGTIAIKYTNKDVSYVSRRMIKTFKIRLGI